MWCPSCRAFVDGKLCPRHPNEVVLDIDGNDPREFATETARGQVHRLSEITRQATRIAQVGLTVALMGVPIFVVPILLEVAEFIGFSRGQFAGMEFELGISALLSFLLGVLVLLLGPSPSIHLARWIVERLLREPFLMDTIRVVGGGTREHLLASAIAVLSERARAIPRLMEATRNKNADVPIDLDVVDPYEALAILGSQAESTTRVDEFAPAPISPHNQRLEDRWMEFISDPRIEAHLPSFANNLTHFNLEWYAAWKIARGRGVPLASDPMFRRNEGE